MPDVPLWDRYHQLLRDYIADGDERQLREVVALSQERGLTLETTSGRVAASMRSVLRAYASLGVCSVTVDVDRRQRSHAAPRARVSDGDRRVTLRTPEPGGDTVVIEIRGRGPGEELPVVRLDYVSPTDDEPAEPLSQPIEPRQLYDVLVELLGHEPHLRTDRPDRP